MELKNLWRTGSLRLQQGDNELTTITVQQKAVPLLRHRGETGPIILKAMSRVVFVDLFVLCRLAIVLMEKMLTGRIWPRKQTHRQVNHQWRSPGHPACPHPLHRFLSNEDAGNQ